MELYRSVGSTLEHSSPFNLGQNRCVAAVKARSGCLITADADLTGSFQDRTLFDVRVFG